MRNNNPFLYKDPDNPYAVKEVVLPVGGIYERDDRKMYSYDFRLTATYNTTIKNAHIINLFAGMEVNSADRHNTWFPRLGPAIRHGHDAVLRLPDLQEGTGRRV